MEKDEFRVLIKHCFLIGKNAAEAKNWLDKYYLDSAPAEATVRKWFAKFRTGHMSTEEDARSGRPKDAVTDENIKKIHKIILNDRKMKLIEIAEALKISKERVGHIVHEYLGMRKLCAKWVPRELTIDQKQQRVDDSVKTMAKLYELGFELLPHPPYSPDLAPSDYFLFADLKRMLAGKKFSTNEQVIAETEAYFEDKEKSYYKNGIEKLEDRYNRCIALEGNYVE
ncbi:histone-lysine N-methyltransferase SETMAR-like [Contarinia nasturtii]|uniref:histone-lysine N-methyltransferase SETMAR-like n=1 Tax=Contarinia nasturtii TaxID=265458 RepID=UPI0012D4263D|nr:histone-lysine N-methyltransferase SETMAR-like [Contarinia nasturtii]